MRRTTLTIGATLIILAVGVWPHLAVLYHAGSPKSYAIIPSATVPVVRVIDGDTIVVRQAGRNETVRFLGMNTPETVDPHRRVQCYGAQASHFMHALLTPGTVVHLESDSMNHDRDVFGRLLRYVSLQDGTDLDAQMIEDGYAYAFIKYPFQRKMAYLKIQTEAQTAARGLWATSTCHGQLNAPLVH